MQTRNIPNIISAFRIVLVIPIIYLLIKEEYGFTLILFAVAGLSDGLDGYLARHYNWTSRLGSILDPLADKLLQVSTYIVLAWSGVLPVWLAIVVIGRDLIIVTGGVIYHMLFGRYEMMPTFLSKVNTVLQILLVLVVIFNEAYYPLPVNVISLFVYLVLLTTILSGLQYVLIWGKRSVEASRADS